VYAARIGFHVMLAEINVACQFAHKIDVNVFRAVGAQRRQAVERSAQIDGAQVNVQPERLAQAEQAAFGPLG
jgi:hypothetical protein